MLRLRLTYRLLTPAWLGGADQVTPEVRMQSFKGLLRTWYRAADPRFRDYEALVFGGIDRASGQSPVLLRPEPVTFQPWVWDERLIARFNKGQGKEMFNGIRYLTGPGVEAFQTKRKALPPGLAITFSLVWTRLAREPATRARQLRGPLAAAWLLGHLGGCGARGRRGFGSLSLESWEADGTGAQAAELETSALPLLHTSPSVRAWYDGLGAEEATLDAWFPERVERRKRFEAHPNVWGKRFNLVLRGRAYGDPRTGWAEAMDDAGVALQRFRRRYPPDYERMKAFLKGEGPPVAPHRASFGLPLAFRFSSTRGAAWINALHDERTRADRHASILHVRVARLADGLHPLYVRLDGPAPGMGGKGGSIPEVGGSRVAPVEKDLTRAFLKHLQGGQ